MVDVIYLGFPPEELAVMDIWSILSQTRVVQNLKEGREGKEADGP